MGRLPATRLLPLSTTACSLVPSWLTSSTSVNGSSGTASAFRDGCGVNEGGPAPRSRAGMITAGSLSAPAMTPAALRSISMWMGLVVG
eukprot:scaffold3615_cov66-Phaeocystis_antarctica.AAC.2